MTCKESLWRNDLFHCMLPGWFILRLLNSFFIYFIAVDMHPLILATQIWWCPIAEMVMCGWVGVWDQINLRLQWGYTIWTMEVRHSVFRKSMLILTLSTVYDNLYHIICWRNSWIRGYTLKALWQLGEACSMNYSSFWWNGISPLGLLLVFYNWGCLLGRSSDYIFSDEYRWQGSKAGVLDSCRNRFEGLFYMPSWNA